MPSWPCLIKESVQSRSQQGSELQCKLILLFPEHLTFCTDTVLVFRSTQTLESFEKPWRETRSVLGNYKSSASLWQCSSSPGVLVFWFKFDNWDVRFHSIISCFSVLVKYLDIGLIKLWRQGIWFPSAKKLQRSAWNLNQKMTFYTLKACVLSVSAFWTTVLKSLANYTCLLWEVVSWLKDIMMNQLF